MGLEQVRVGRLASELANELEVWRQRFLAGKPRTQSTAKRVTVCRWANEPELASAKKRISELEQELAATKLASELFAEGRVVRQPGQALIH